MELYIHIPFCVKKCDYCDFLSFPGTEGMRKSYQRALEQEIKALAGKDERELSSIFIGGGTPSLLDGEDLESLMDTVRESFTLEMDCETSIEVNPGTMTRRKAKGYKSAGINRVSIGCQSVKDEELRALGRIHRFREFEESYEAVREAGIFNVNVDLMSAIPGQDAVSWEENLRSIAEMQPEHISAYSLIIEEGTPFSQRELPLAEEEEERRMYEMTWEILKTYGYGQYEISNYAKSGKECRHNMGYWQRADYLGVGLGAASLVDNVRFSNTDVLEEYLDNAACPEKLHRNIERLSVKEQMEEFMFLGLRLTKGVSIEVFEEEFHVPMKHIYGAPLAKMSALNLLEEKEGHVGLTRRGISLSNQVFAEFLLE